MAAISQRAFTDLPVSGVDQTAAAENSSAVITSPSPISIIPSNSPVITSITFMSTLPSTDAGSSVPTSKFPSSTVVQSTTSAAHQTSMSSSTSTSQASVSPITNALPLGLGLGLGLGIPFLLALFTVFYLLGRHSSQREGNRHDTGWRNWIPCFPHERLEEDAQGGRPPSYSAMWRRPDSIRTTSKAELDASTLPMLPTTREISEVNNGLRTNNTVELDPSTLSIAREIS
ncbi:hypothetical protein MMC10_005880 [Thelotrema lepadinum]|nr:hypothetical protein [Thelotrema lepadinum]